MCLTTSDPEIKVAQEDILVYKQLHYPRKGLFNFFLPTKKGRAILQTEHQYIRGKTQKFVEIVAVPPRYEPDDEYRVNEGYHSDKYKNDSSNALFVIPKGTKYIEGFNNSTKSRPNYVSETIIFKKRLKRK